MAFFGQGTSSLSLTNLSTLSASACVRLPVALPRTLGGTTALNLMAEDDSPAVLVDAGRSYTSGSANGLGGATPVPLATSAESIGALRAVRLIWIRGWRREGTPHIGETRPELLDNISVRESSFDIVLQLSGKEKSSLFLDSPAEHELPRNTNTQYLLKFQADYT